MNPRWQHRHRPPWWPVNEPWPPGDPGARWRRGRSRFVRRVGCLFAALLFLSAIGGASLLSMVLGRSGIVRTPEPISLWTTAGIAAFAVLLAAFIGGMRRVAFPLGEIVGAADRVAGGDFAVRVGEHGPRSLRAVARAFNSMTARLASQDEQRRHLMADVAHELRTPLTVIQGRLEGLLDGVYPRDDARLLELLEDTRVLARLVEDLRTVANTEAGALRLQIEDTDLSVLVHDTVRVCAPDAERRDVRLIADVPSDLPLMAIDPVRIREVLINLLTNAIRHTNGGGTITVGAQAGRDVVTIEVTDTGSGVAPEDLPRIFDRFYKGTASHGSGLGLAIARGLVAAHGGTIEARSELGRGTTIAFTLPVRPGVDSGLR
jgi:two-component system OmpR family sensor kinase/two-component system sensor histidine kinase BaeS